MKGLDYIKKRVTILTLLVLIISGSFIFLAFNNTYDFKVSKNLDIFFNLFREVSLYYVDDTDPEKLINKSIEGMLNSLDPYTTFIPEKELNDFEFQTTGKYGGIGALIRKSEDYIIISEPYEGFPADKAGLQAGDKILKIDGHPIKDKELRDVSELLKGSPNSECKLLVKKANSDKTEKITILREEIKINNVPYYGIIKNNVGYIRLSGFTKGASEEVKIALNDLIKNQHAHSIILDIRDNPGGLLIEAVNISNLFVDKGQEIVSTKGKVKQWDYVYKTESQPVDTTIPLAVLVSRSSASASEIVSGSLQDLDRAIIIGQRTFGKGLVQTTRPLSYNAHLKVTTAKYYIPSGRCIQALDYSNRNEDGSVGHIPDSLISEFTTRNGRKVFDGGGIIPDINLEVPQFSKIAISLFTKNLIFDFATLYVQSHDKVNSVEELSISDSIYSNFVHFLSDKDYDYQTKSEEQLDKLIEMAKREKYYETSTGEFNQLKIKLAHDKSKDLVVFKNEIKQLLKEEIATRYFYQKGRILASIINDEEINKAIEVLKNSSEYNLVLAKNQELKTDEKLN